MTRFMPAAALALLCVACSPARPVEPAPVEPAPVAATVAPVAVPAAALVALRNVIGATEAKYSAAEVDLNGDGAKEVVAYLLSAAFCGSGGCPMIVLTPSGDGYKVVTRTTVTQLPIRVLSTSTNGWRDLSVAIGGGGGPSGQVKLAFVGKSYPTNPSVVDASVEASDGDSLIAADDMGQPLP